MINRGFRDSFAAFVARDVRFLIVGGYAVAFHGHPRFTKDVDVLTDVTGVEFEEAWSSRVPSSYGDVSVAYIGLE